MQQWRPYVSRAKGNSTKTFFFVTSPRPSFNGFTARYSRQLHNDTQAFPTNTPAPASRLATFRFQVTKRRVKYGRSQEVIDALRSSGHDIAIPRQLAPRKIDLSTTPVGNRFDLSSKHQRREASIDPEEAVLPGRSEHAHLSTILAKHLRAHWELSRTNGKEGELDLDLGHPITEDQATSAIMEDEPRVSPIKLGHGIARSACGSLISESEEAHLQSRGYNVEDVEHWAALLCEKDSDVAARKMLAHQRSDVGDSRRNPLPIFVFLLFLRRPHLSSAALRYCLIMVSLEVQRKQESVGTSVLANDAAGSRLAATPVIDDSSFFILVVRLLRHARLNWPETLVMIAAMFMKFNAIDKPSNSLGAQLTVQKHARLSQKYNQLLSLLALPVSQHPFSSIVYQQRAQFDLLKDMADHRPPLNLSRQGYQAIIDVQLANKKTHKERDWDNLKTRAWPPWKQERTGLDADKNRDYGTSRAMHVINRARDAGYGADPWEVVASALSGWNVDQSPTIQTRTFAPLKTVTAPVKAQSNLAIEHLANPALWAARVKTTRTVQEAWACFLTYKDQKLPATPDVYFTMLAKIASEDRRVARLKSPRRKLKPTLLVSAGPINAGDTLEVIAPSDSPKEATYLRSPVPTFDKLVTESFLLGLRPGGHQLVFLLKTCTSLQQGLDWLRKSDLESYTILQEATTEHKMAINDVPPSHFFAYVNLLCRFPLVRWQLDEPPVIFAQRLLRIRKYATRPTWHALLTTVGHPNVTLRLRGISSNRHPARFEHYTRLQQVFSDMELASLSPDTETLRIICEGIEPAILDAQDVIAARRAEAEFASISPSDQGDPTGISLRSAVSLLGSCPHYALSIFNTVFGVGSRKPTTDVLKLAEMHDMPRLLAAPDPACLHTYVRVLGAMSDWQGLFNLVTWMVKYKHEIEQAVDMPRNGCVLLRRTLVAIRVYLERTWVEGDAKRVDELKAPKNTIKSMKKTIRDVEEWGGWPEDRECEDYCRIGSFPGKRRVREPKRV